MIISTEPQLEVIEITVQFEVSRILFCLTLTIYPRLTAFPNCLLNIKVDNSIPILHPLLEDNNFKFGLEM